MCGARVRDMLLDRSRRTAEVDASPESIALHFDPRMRLVDDHPSRNPEPEGRDQEGKGSVATNALLRKREVHVDVVVALGNVLRRRESPEVADQTAHGFGRREVARQAEG